MLEAILAITIAVERALEGIKTALPNLFKYSVAQKNGTIVTYKRYWLAPLLAFVAYCAVFFFKKMGIIAAITGEPVEVYDIILSSLAATGGAGVVQSVFDLIKTVSNASKEVFRRKRIENELVIANTVNSVSTSTNNTNPQ